MLQLSDRTGVTTPTAHPADADAVSIGVVDRYRGLRFRGAKRSARRRSAARAIGGLRTSTLAPPSNKLVMRKPESMSTEQAAFLHDVFARAGLLLPHYRLSPLARRLPACLRALKTHSLASARRQIDTDPHALDTAVDALVIGVTGFFRDTIVFDHLRRAVIPALLEMNRPLRVWSAACSDGAELYSVGMLLRAHGAPIDTLLGTDCRPNAIQKARTGRYTRQQVQHIVPALRKAYLHPRGGAFEVHPELRAMTDWEQADLLDGTPPHDHPPTGWDMILCRNMAIYVNDAAAAFLWSTLASALRPGGFLVVGKAERPRVIGLRRVGPSIYRKP